MAEEKGDLASSHPRRSVGFAEDDRTFHDILQLANISGRSPRCAGEWTTFHCEEYFVGRFAKESGNSVRHIGKQTLGQLHAYQADLKKHPPKRGVSVLDDREMEMIEAALAETHGRIPGPTGAAAKLGISRRTLESKIRRLGIDKYGQKRFTP